MQPHLCFILWRPCIIPTWPWAGDDPSPLWSSPGQLSLHWLVVEMGKGGQLDSSAQTALSTDRHKYKLEALLVCVVGVCERDPLGAGPGSDSLLTPV